MLNPRVFIKASIILVVCTAATVVVAQTFTSFFAFGWSDGATPHAPLIQAADGNLYGTTSSGGTWGNGAVFKITPTGTLSALYSFCSQASCFDGAHPYAGLTQGSDGDFYGTTRDGGLGNLGTVFKITSAGGLTTLYSFCAQTTCSDGSGPWAGLIQGSDGNFYGTTYYGGANSCEGNGCGTVFKVTPAGALTTLHSFDSTTGAHPHAGLIQATDNELYGTTDGGGAYNYGTIFKMSLAGALTILHSFDSIDGAHPYAGLIQATDGNFYGTTSLGGNVGLCKAQGCGTIFNITPSGTLTTLHSFNSTDGAYPYAGLIQAADGNFYGATWSGGAYPRNGTIFEITPDGTLATSHSFNVTDGAWPDASLIQATDGNLYGTTSWGGNSLGCGGCGTVFRLAAAPAVKLTPTSLGFGNQTFDETSAAKTVTLKNSGAALLNIGSVAIKNSSFAIYANTCSGAMLAIGETCTVSVTFTPASLGKLTGTLSFTDNASDSPQVVSLSGTCISPTSATLASSLNPSTYGQTIVFTAKVTASGPVPTGTVVFTWRYFTETYTIGTAVLNSAGVATLTKSDLNAGLYPMAAVYKGDTNHLSSTSTVLNQTVLQTTSNATLTSTPNPSAVGQAVTFTAKITSPTVTAKGPVTFTLGQTTLGTAQLSAGKATFTTSSLLAGSNVIKVMYDGNSNIAKSSAAVTQIVLP